MSAESESDVSAAGAAHRPAPIDTHARAVPPPPPPPPPPPAPVAPPRKRRRFGCLAIFLIVGALSVLGLVIIAVVAPMGLAAGLSGAGGSDEYPSLTESLSYGYGENKVVRIPVYGPIVRSQSSGVFGATRDPVDEVLRMIRTAENDFEVLAIILEVDSPGGGVTDSDLIYKALMDFKSAMPGRQIVAHFGDMAASGGYYIAAAADHIVAHPTTITGSIGVLISTINLKGFSEKTGIKGVTIKSGENKDLLNPFEDMSPAQIEILQKTVDAMRTRFVSLVAEGRNMSFEEVDPIADGSIYAAGEAVRIGLVDEIGYWDDVMAVTRRMLGVDDIAVYRYSEERGLADILLGVRMPTFSPDALLHSRSRMMYIWRP